MTELHYREVRSKRRLHSFLADDSEAHVSFLDHSDIVASVPNARNSGAREFCDVLCHKSFLSWAAPAYAYCCRLLRSLEKLVL
jgi:hypothetical protein